MVHKKYLNAYFFLILFGYVQNNVYLCAIEIITLY